MRGWWRKMSGWRSLKRCYGGADWISHDGLDCCTQSLAETGVLLEGGLLQLRIRLDHFVDRGQRSTVWRGVVFVINVVEVQFAERLSDERLVAVVVLVEGRPLRALALEARFGCAVVDVATFPGKARFSRFSSCPLDLWKLFKRYIDCFSFLHVRTDLYGGKQFRRHDICTVHYIRYDLPTSLTATRCPRSPRLRKWVWVSHIWNMYLFSRCFARTQSVVIKSWFTSLEILPLLKTMSKPINLFFVTRRKRVLLQR